MYCEFIDKNNHALFLQTDLKTINGYKNRAKRLLKFYPNLVQLKIYYCSDSIGYYSDKTKSEIINI